MSNLKFAEIHILVAFLEKPEESDGFAGIIDFLNASSIRYALTVNPTIYTSCIKQFWATAKAKTVNREVQIQALVDGKKVIVTETSVKRALQLKMLKLTFYKAFFSPQWKFLIHIILQCISVKTTDWNEFSSTMASTVICLVINQKFNFSKYIFDNMVENLEGGVKFLMYPRFVQVFLDKQVEGMTKHKEIYVTPSHTKKVFANMKRARKGFSGRVTPLFQTMMVQSPKKLSEGLEIPTDPQHTPIIIQPSTSQPQKKQPRRKQRKDIEVPQPSGSTEPITDEATNEEHVPTHSNDPLFSGEDRLQLKELLELCIKLSERVLDLENTKTSQAAEITKLKERVKKLERRNMSRTPGLKRLRKGRKIADLDTDAEEVEVEKAVSTAEVTTVSVTTITVDELTMAQTLIEIKAAKLKAVTTAATITTTAVTRPKARGVIVQEPSKFRTTTSSSQTSQLPQLNAELEEEEKLAKQREEDANIAEWDNVQAMIDADYELAAKLQNMAGFTHSQLKNKSIDEVQKAFDKTMDWIDSFVSMDSEVVKGVKEKDEGSVTRAEESSSKRAGTELEQEKIKKQKIVDDQEEAEMKKHMEIVVDEEEIAVDVIPLATKPPIIVDWKIIKEGKMGYFQLIRADGSSRTKVDVLEKSIRTTSEVWKAISSSGVHFVRFQNLHIFMLVEKKYLLTPATITAMLNKKLQVDHWNEMCYQLLKLMTK
ncbi:hypothetical protein Tco_0287787 [Tanacetum coccineum]